MQKCKKYVILKEREEMYKPEKDMYQVYNNGKLQLSIEKLKKIADILPADDLSEEQEERERKNIDNFFCFSEHPGIRNNEGKNFVLIAGRGVYESTRLNKVRELIEQGVYVFTKKNLYDCGKYNYYETDSYTEANHIWEKIGTYIRDIFDIPAICITGSVGKSTVTQLTKAVFAKQGNIFGTPGNLNTMDIIVTKMARDFNEKYDYIVQECGGGRRDWWNRRPKLCARRYFA